MSSQAIGSLFISLGLDSAAFVEGVKVTQTRAQAFAASLRKKLNVIGDAPGIARLQAGLASVSAGLGVAAAAAAGAATVAMWFDTATNQLKQRNGTNSAWLVLVFAGRKISADGPGLSGFGDLSADRTAVLNLGALPDKTAAEYVGPHFVVTNGAVAKSQAKMTVVEAKKALSLGGLAGIDLPSSLDPALGLRGDGTWAEDQAAAIASGAAGAPKIKGRALDIAAGRLTGTTALVDLDDAAQILLVGSAAVTGNSESSLIRARVGYQLSSNNGVNWGAEIPLSEVYFASLPRNERAATSGQVLIDMVGYNAIRLNGFGTLTGLSSIRRGCDMPWIEHVSARTGEVVARVWEDDPVPEAADLLALAAELRWRRETGGITVAGLAVATDDRSKLMLSGARIAAMADPAYATRWKTPAGWVDLNAATIIALSDAVQAHVAACFALEAQVAEQIEAGLLTTPEAVEAAFA